MADSVSLISALAERYAGALFDLALERGRLEAEAEAVESLGELIEGSGELRNMLASPVISAREGAAAIAAILAKARIGGLCANLAGVAARNRRLFILPAIPAAFRERLAEHRGEAQAEAIFAAPPSKERRNALEAALREACGKPVALRGKVDSSLIGGAIIRLGSRQVDASIRFKLSSLQRQLEEAGT